MPAEAPDRGNRFIIGVLLRPSLLLVIAVLAGLAVCVVPLAGADAAPPPKASLATWTKAKHAKVLAPAKAPPPPPPAPAPRAAAASAGPKSKSKSDGPSVSGKVAVFGFTGEGAGRVQQVVVSTLRTRGLQVTTGLRPVDSAEQFREMAATLRLAAYIEGTVGGDGSRGQADRVAPLLRRAQRAANRRRQRIVAADRFAADAPVRRGRQAAQGRAARDAHQRRHAD
jgi:hypothetical protein